jgi:hypothetical protein
MQGVGGRVGQLSTASTPVLYCTVHLMFDPLLDKLQYIVLPFIRFSLRQSKRAPLTVQKVRVLIVRTYRGC